MSFTIFSTGTTANVSEVMANFYHIADGNRCGYIVNSGTMVTTNAYLGNSTYTYDNLYTRKLTPYEGTNRARTLIASGSFNTTVTTRTIYFTLTSDTEYYSDIYLHVRTRTATTSAYVVLVNPPATVFGAIPITTSAVTYTGTGSTFTSTAGVINYPGLPGIADAFIHIRQYWDGSSYHKMMTGHKIYFSEAQTQSYGTKIFSHSKPDVAMIETIGLGVWDTSGGDYVHPPKVELFYELWGTVAE